MKFDLQKMGLCSLESWVTNTKCNVGLKYANAIKNIYEPREYNRKKITNKLLSLDSISKY